MKTIIENQKKIEELKKKILILENEIDDCENAEKLVKENEDKIVDLQKLLIDQLENKIEVLTQKLEKLKNAESSKHLLKQRAIISELTLLLDMLNKGQKISSIAEEIVYDINQTESEGIPVSLKDDNVIKLKKSKIEQDFEARIDDLEPTIEKMELQAIAEASDVLDEVKSSISEEMIDNLDILNEDIKSIDEKIEDVEKEQELENLDEIEKNLIEEDIELSIKNDAIDNVLKEAHDLEINLDAELKSEDTLKEEDVVEDKILIEEETSKFEENFDDAINSEKTDDLKIANKSEDLITANATDDISGESVELLSFDKPADIFSEEANNIDKQIDNFDEIKEDLKIDENQQSIEQLENLVNLDDLEKLEDDINLDADEKIEVSEAEKEIDILKDELNEE
ncbi:MAG TPA: hypothetical protein PLM75_09340, partial [bacterium]|nr:hypothetical protein [bacterium]